MDPAEQADAVPRGGRRGARMRRPVAQRQQQDEEDDEQIDEVRFSSYCHFKEIHHHGLKLSVNH